MEEQTVRTQKKRPKLAGWLKILMTVVLTLAVSTGLWCALLGRSGLTMVQTYLLARFAFVEADADLAGATDAGLAAFVGGLGDRWSYYRSAEQYKQLTATRANSYVGVGITVDYTREEGLLVRSVTEGGRRTRREWSQGTSLLPWTASPLPGTPGRTARTKSPERRALRWCSPCWGKTGPLGT